MTDTDTSGKDWFAWHSPYDIEGSPLAVRLGLVQAHLRRALEEAPAGEVRIVSLCAGQGRDVIGALVGHPRRRDVRARLVELDPRNTAVAARAAADAELDIEVVTGDASMSDAYIGAAPAHIVLACGIFGNVSEGDVKHCVSCLPMLCEPGAYVVWTRHRRPPDLTPAIRRWFEDAGYVDAGLDVPEDQPFVGVGACRWAGPAGVVEPGMRYFTFVGDPLPPG